MPEKPKSAAEKYMAETLDFLLNLDEDEREQLEDATRIPFTMDAPAPQRKPKHLHEAMSCTVQVGTMEAVELLLHRGFNPVSLNFAHSYNCGGGFEHANGSQEEALFRTSTLSLSLWPHRRIDDGPGVLARGMWIGNYDEILERKEAFYPYSILGGCYSPYVKLVRKVAKGRDAPLWKKEEMRYQKPFGVISVAAQDVPRDGFFDEDLLRQKCRTVLHLAAKYGHDSLILGAFGCGFFDNPPDTVAEVFAELLNQEFKDAFKVALFAIPDRAGENLDEFTKVFPLLTVPEFDSQLGVSRRFSTESAEAAFMAAGEEVNVPKAGVAGGYQRGRKDAPKRGNRKKKDKKIDKETSDVSAMASDMSDEDDDKKNGKKKKKNNKNNNEKDSDMVSVTSDLSVMSEMSEMDEDGEDGEPRKKKDKKAKKEKKKRKSKVEDDSGDWEGGEDAGEWEGGQEEEEPAPKAAKPKAAAPKAVAAGKGADGGKGAPSKKEDTPQTQEADGCCCTVM